MPDFIVVEHMDAGVRDKIINDPDLPEHYKHETLEACKDKASEAEVSDAFSDFCKTKRLVGAKVVNFNDTQFVGHIKLLESVSKYISRALRTAADPMEIEPAEVNDHIRALSFPGTPLRKREAAIWFEEELFSRFPAYQVSGRPTWLFEEETSGDARTIFDSVEISSLPCRLGLPEPKLWGEVPYTYPNGLEFVGFAFQGSKLVSPCRPTALDGDYESVQKIWLIGGRTKPLPHGPADAIALGGLLECVSEPTSLYDGLKNTYVFIN